MFWKSKRRRQSHKIDSVPLQVQLLEDRQLLSGSAGGQAATPPQNGFDGLEPTHRWFSNAMDMNHPVSRGHFLNKPTHNADGTGQNGFLPFKGFPISCDAMRLNVDTPCNVEMTNMLSDVVPPNDTVEESTDDLESNGNMTGVADQSIPQADYQPLINLIETVVQDDCDTDGSQVDDEIEPRLALITNQNQAIHEDVSNLLSQLRRVQDLQVTIDVRFITLQDDFFEQIGVDFDFSLNDTVNGPSDQTSPNDQQGGSSGSQSDNSSDSDELSNEESGQGSNNIGTDVSAPDGGTVLLGGIKRLREGRSERGVPMLNKIPYINRLFKNTGVGRETQSLMLMVTPRIIIQEE